MSIASEEAIELNTLWIGGDPGPMEILCLMSAAARGHHVRLFSYTTFDNVPDCIEQADARAVLPESAVISHGRTGSMALFADRFRYELIRQGYGAWTDADMLYLRPVATGNGNIYGFEDDNTEVAIGFLAYDAESEMAEELCEWSARAEMVPPWLSWQDRVWYRLRQMAGRRPKLSDLPWGTIGPTMFTYMLKKHGLIGWASPWQRFYPVPYAQKALPFLADGDAERFITAQTEAVHLWRQGLKGGLDGKNEFKGRTVPFEENSLVWKIAREVGLSSSSVWQV